MGIRECTLCLVCCLLAIGAAAEDTRAAPPYDRSARLLERGHARRAAGDTLSAIGDYRDAITAAPRRPDAYLALGALYRELGEPQRAIEVYTAASRAQVQSEPLLLAHAEALGAVGDGARALAILRRLTSRVPDSAAALEALAALTEARGDFIAALAARRALLARDERDDSDDALRVKALEHLLGEAERARSPATCEEPEAGSVARALARCP